MKLFKLLLSLIVILGLLAILAGCPKIADTAVSAEPKGMVYFNFFDTVSYIYSYAEDTQEDFEARCKGASDILQEYHKLFDIYYEHTGVVNLRTLNLNAGGEAMKVDEKLIDFLLYAKQLYDLTGGEMNIMMGSVLSLWHDCREQAGNDPANAHIPTEDELKEARLHTDISLLEIDEENGTVRISDPDAAIDVGALGKGYATEQAAQYLRSVGAESYVLNIGGNIRIIGHKTDGGGWATGIKNPKNPETYVKTLTLADTSCVTSGDYERYFTVDGQKYHHIIDKDTLMPAAYFSAVCIITPDSGLADALSTALFAMRYEDGLELVQKLGNVEVLWITTDGTEYSTPGFDNLVKS
ncbi:MAG: FAD:protein FMN transferase [Oscillospiraceae bacterium]|nr:FAD:protein FMN transferase [Oscillospiraceae bacterium]MBQ9929204.1 FAD:protein FMN transferase [Oscillospiraceae bacterium]